MAERFSDSEKPFVPKQPSLEERLKEYPELKAKIETMLRLSRMRAGMWRKGAEAERRIIEELRQMGNEVLHSWARRHYRKRKMSTTLSRGRIGRKRKLHWYTRLGKIEIEEQIFTQGRRQPQIRPFFESAEVKCRGYSQAVQRASRHFG